MKKALIVYSTWAGSTRAIAERMAETIRQNSHQATVLSAKEEIDVNAFDLIIIGSSIHAGRTIGSFRKFIRRNLKDLCNHPVALFVSCANLMNDNDQTRKETLAWLDSAIKPFSCLQPISKGLFAGAALTEGENYRNLNIFVPQNNKRDAEEHRC